MKVLLDTCVWGGSLIPIESAGHDVVWSGNWQEDPGDSEILARAFAEERVLVTLDKDFGEIAILHGQPHKGILRLVGFPARQQASVIIQILESHSNDLALSSLLTAEPGRVRIRASE